MTELDILIYVISLVFVGFSATSMNDFSLRIMAEKYPDLSRVQLAERYWIGNIVAIILPVWNTIVALFIVYQFFRGLVWAATTRKQRLKK